MDMTQSFTSVHPTLTPLAPSMEERKFAEEVLILEMLLTLELVSVGEPMPQKLGRRWDFESCVKSEVEDTPFTQICCNNRVLYNTKGFRLPTCKNSGIPLM